MAFDISRSANFGSCNVATGLCKLLRLRRYGLFGGFDKVIRLHVRMREQPPDDIRIVCTVVGHLGHWPGAKIAVPCKTGIARQVRRGGPHTVIALSITV